MVFLFGCSRFDSFYQDLFHELEFKSVFFWNEDLPVLNWTYLKVNYNIIINIETNMNLFSINCCLL